MGWKGDLIGFAEELRALQKLYPAPPVQVVREEDTYSLVMPEFETERNAGMVRSRFESVLTRLNAVGLLKFGRFRPITLGTLRETVPDVFSAQVVPPGSLAWWQGPSEALRAFVEHEPNRPPVMNARTGPLVESLPEVERWVDAADRWPDADVIFRLLVSAPNDWRQLYVVYEIIEHDVKQPSGIQRRGWATRDEIRRFKGTANSRRALGDAARHGKPTHALPNPMSMEQAQALILRLVTEWLRWKHISP